eukprot:scaffold296806_cov15-Prasinocladus_malaysianus.AAC.1
MASQRGVNVLTCCPFLLQRHFQDCTESDKWNDGVLTQIEEGFSFRRYFRYCPQLSKSKQG